MARPTSATQPRHEGLLPAVRRWIVVPVALAVLGGALAGLAGTRSRPTAEVLLTLQVPTSDLQTQDRYIQSAVQELATRNVFQAAAAASGTDSTDLRNRTRVTAVSNSLVLSIDVTAASQDDAVAQADAVSDAALAQDSTRTAEELQRLRDDTVRLMNDPGSKVDDSAAERARVQRLGDELAGSQSTLVSGAGTLSVLESAQAVSSGVNPLVLAALGAAGGLVLGVALALFIGTRRGKVGSTRELSRLYPEVPVLEPNELGALLLIEATDMSTIVVAGLRTSAKTLQEVGGVVGERLAQAGREVTLVDGAFYPSTGAALAPPRNVSGHILVRDMTVVTTTLNRSLVRQASRDASTMLIIVVERQSTRLDWLGEYLNPGVGDRTYLLVHQRSPQWDS